MTRPRCKNKQLQDHNFITTVEALNSFSRQVMESRNAAVGLNFLMDTKVIQVSLSDNLTSIDLNSFENPTDDLMPLFDALSNVEIVGYDLQTIIRELIPYGFLFGKLFCTKLAAQVLGMADVKHDARQLTGKSTFFRTKLAEAKLTATMALEMNALPIIVMAASVRVDVAKWTHLAELAEAKYPKNDERNTTYGVTWLRHVQGGMVRPTWNQIGAATGRMTSTKPNLQGVPKKEKGPYRECFIAEDGHVFVRADYSQIELRIAAKYANETKMIEAFKRGEDLHALTAANILNKPLSDVDEKDRQLGKAVNFGLIYGIAPPRLRESARDEYGVEVTILEAVSYREKFFRTYPKFQEWHDRVRGELKSLKPNAKYETRSMGGRRRIIPVMTTNKEPKKRYLNVSAGLNSPIQMMGADGLKSALRFMWDRLEFAPCEIKVVHFVHDEIVIMVPEADAGDASDWLIECMKDGMSEYIKDVPFDVDAEIVTSFAK